MELLVQVVVDIKKDNILDNNLKVKKRKIRMKDGIYQQVIEKENEENN